MTEEEYIQSTNLSKTRIAIHCIRDILPDETIITTNKRKEILEILYKIVKKRKTGQSNISLSFLFKSSSSVPVSDKSPPLLS